MISNCQTCSKSFTYYPSNKSGKYCSVNCCTVSPEWREKQRVKQLGKKMPQSMKDLASKRFKGVKKSQEHIAKIVATRKKTLDLIGRKTDIVTLIRTSKANEEWRRQVFERDKYTCVKCGDNKGGNLEADHIISLSFLIEEARLTGKENYYDIDNGRTLCTDCHKGTDSYAKHWKHHIEGKLMLAIADTGGDYQKTTEGLITQLKERLE